jgi:hypothetical protein
MDDAESGMDDAESGMNDIKYKHYAQQTPQNYLQKFSFLRKENDLLFLIHSYVHPPPSFYDSNNDVYNNKSLCILVWRVFSVKRKY